MVQPLTLSRLPEPIVVLGGGGFIGSNLVRRLAIDGYDVTAVDVQFPKWRMNAVLGVDQEHRDLRDFDSTYRAMWTAGTVFHLAADMGGVGYFHSDADLGAAMRNGQITLNVMRAAAQLGCRLFYASSACAYPVEQQQTVTFARKLAEDQLGMGTPDALYGAEKLHGLRLASKIPNARVGVLHTVYGPLQEHEGRRMKFPAAVATKALDARTTGKLELWGDGNQRRSYLYVDDAVKRIVAIASADGYDGPVNVGASGSVSCMEVAEMCLQIVGADEAVITTNPAEPSGVLGRDCSNRKFEALYGKMPQTSLREGFGRFIEWLESVR